jgi:hypothetical protein
VFASRINVCVIESPVLAFQFTSNLDLPQFYLYLMEQSELLRCLCVLGNA